MTTLTCILAALFIGYIGYCIGHLNGYTKGHEKGTSYKQLRNYTYIVEIEDEPEFKEHELT